MVAPGHSVTPINVYVVLPVYSITLPVFPIDVGMVWPGFAFGLTFLSVIPKWVTVHCSTSRFSSVFWPLLSSYTD